MKKVSLFLTTMLAVCATTMVFATPQTTFKEGQAQIDLGTWNVKGSTNTSGVFLDNDNKISGSTDSKWDLQGGATYGLSDKTAVEYHYYDMQTKDKGRDIGGYSQELNLLYSLHPNVAAFAGWNRINTNWGDARVGMSNVTNNVAQIGVIGKVPVADQLDLYGKAALGTDDTTIWEAGLGYKLRPDLDLNAGYRYLNTKRTDDNSMTFKGFLAGLSYRFGK